MSHLRRYRDAWNRCIVHRVARTHGHSLKIKGRVRARGARGQQWYTDRRANFIKSRVRTQNLWLLHVAGDWHHAFETIPHGVNPHLMRAMLVQNLAVDQRFANGCPCPQIGSYFNALLLRPRILLGSRCTAQLTCRGCRVGFSIGVLVRQRAAAKHCRRAIASWYFDSRRRPR